MVSIHPQSVLNQHRLIVLLSDTALPYSPNLLEFLVPWGQMVKIMTNFILDRARANIGSGGIFEKGGGGTILNKGV